jgi:hypothetical protein
MKLDCRAIGNLAQPHIQIFALSRLKEKDVVAVVQLSQFIELSQFRFRVEFGILSAMREQRGNIIQEVAVSVEIESETKMAMHRSIAAKLTCR